MVCTSFVVTLSFRDFVTGNFAIVIMLPNVVFIWSGQPYPESFISMLL